MHPGEDGIPVDTPPIAAASRDPSAAPLAHAAPPSASADDLLRAIRRIVQGITIHSKQLYRRSGLTVPQLLCLRAVAAAGTDDITAAQVSRQVRVSPATVTGILDRLERDGLLRRERRSRDRRKISLVLTDQGRERLKERTLQDLFVERAMSLQQEERLAMLRALEQVVDMMDASSLDVAPILVSGDLTKAEPEP